MAEARKCYAEAFGYACGFQDAKGDNDTTAATDFAIAYGIVAADYELERRGNRPPVRRAYQAFIENRPID